MKFCTISREYFCATFPVDFSYSREYNSNQKEGNTSRPVAGA